MSIKPGDVVDVISGGHVGARCSVVEISATGKRAHIIKTTWPRVDGWFPLWRLALTVSNDKVRCAACGGWVEPLFAESGTCEHCGRERPMIVELGNTMETPAKGTE